MPISFSCPECDHAIKAPDELAGRRVKCPSCKAPVAVPARVAAKRPAQSPAHEGERPAASKQAVRPEPPRRSAPPVEDADERPRGKPARDDDEDLGERPRRQPARDDDEGEDDRPRRKGRADDQGDGRRRTAKSGNKGLIIGLCIGGSVLVVGGVVLVIILSSGGSGSNKGGGAATRPADPQVKLHLQQIGIAYHACFDAFRKAPSNAEDLRPFLEGGMNATFDNLTNGTIVFIYNVRLTDMLEGTSNTIVAYEKDVPTRGGPVLFGDGLVREMDAAEFARTPKATKR